MHEKIKTSGKRSPMGGRMGRGGEALPLGGVDGVVERLALKSGAFPLWQCSLSLSLTFCQNGFRLHKMLEIEVSLLQNCLKKGK